MSCRLLDLLAHVVFALQIEHVRDEVERILVVLYLRIEACEIETVGEVLLVDVAKVLVSSRVYKLCTN